MSRPRPLSLFSDVTRLLVAPSLRAITFEAVALRHPLILLRQLVAGVRPFSARPFPAPRCRPERSLSLTPSPYSFFYYYLSAIGFPPLSPNSRVSLCLTAPTPLPECRVYQEDLSPPRSTPAAAPARFFQYSRIPRLRSMRPLCARRHPKGFFLVFFEVDESRVSGFFGPSVSISPLPRRASRSFEFSTNATSPSRL